LAAHSKAVPFPGLVRWGYESPRAWLLASQKIQTLPVRKLQLSIEIQPKTFAILSTPEILASKYLGVPDFASANFNQQKIFCRAIKPLTLF